MSAQTKRRMNFRAGQEGSKSRIQLARVNLGERCQGFQPEQLDNCKINEDSSFHPSRRERTWVKDSEGFPKLVRK